MLLPFIQPPPVSPPPYLLSLVCFFPLTFPAFPAAVHILVKQHPEAFQSRLDLAQLKIRMFHRTHLVQTFKPQTSSITHQHYIILGGCPLRGKSSMCMMCLKYRIILLIVIKNPLLTYFLLRGRPVPRWGAYSTPQTPSWLQHSHIQRQLDASTALPSSD